MCWPRFREIFERHTFVHFRFCAFRSRHPVNGSLQLVDVEITFERFNLETIGGT